MQWNTEIKTPEARQVLTNNRKVLINNRQVLIKVGQVMIKSRQVLINIPTANTAHKWEYVFNYITGQIT